MPLQLTQTATTTGMDAPAVMCSTGTTISAAPVQKLTPSTGGVAGGAVTVTITGGAVLFAQVFFETPASDPGLTSWEAGNWVVRLNVTTTAGATWVQTWVCRVNSTGVNQATVGSLTGQSTSLGTLGVKTHTVSGASQVAGAGDRPYIVCVMSTPTVPRNVGITFDQLIDTPLVAGGGGRGNRGQPTWKRSLGVKFNPFRSFGGSGVQMVERKLIVAKRIVIEADFKEMASGRANRAA